MIASEAGVYYVHRGGEPASKVEPTEREQSVQTEQEGAVDKKRATGWEKGAESLPPLRHPLADRCVCVREIALWIVELHWINSK